MMGLSLGVGMGRPAASEAVPDETAPTVTETGYNGSDTITLTSDEAGTLYYLVDDNATRTAAQVIAGGGASVRFVCRGKRREQRGNRRFRRLGGRPLSALGRPGRSRE